MFREDIVTKMCRNCVKFPEDGDVPTHVSCLSLVVRKQVFGVSDQGRHKPGCAITEYDYRLEISDLGSRGIVLFV